MSNQEFFNIPLSADELLAEARRVSGINIVDHDAVEPLTVLHQSINEEGSLFAEGAVSIQRFIMRSLVNRLRMLRDFSAHPEIAEQEIKAPVFVCGSTRTGSTKTQKLLAASGDFNWLTFWKSLNPALISGDRNESPDARIQDTAELTQWFDDVSPAMKTIHALHPHEPEEESFVLAHSLLSPVITGMVEAPSYIQWLMTQDLSQSFTFLKDTLKYLQWQGYADSEKRWLLKSPFYAGLEPVLLSVFPDAQLIMSHRHPLQTIPSTCSLFTSYRHPYSNIKINAPAVVAGSAIPMDMHLDVRENCKDIDFLDIYYKDLLESVETVAKKTYGYLNMPLKPTSLKNILDWDKNNPKHKKGIHKYSLEEFDLTEEMVTQAYSRYIAFLEQNVTL